MDQSPPIETQIHPEDPAIESLMPNAKHSWKFIILGVFAVVMFGIIAFLVGRRSLNRVDTTVLTNISPTLTKESQSVISPITPDQNEWKTYESKDFKNTGDSWIWKPFTLYHPSSWTVLDESGDQSMGLMLSLRISKNDGSYFTIIQGFGEGGRCLYPEDSDYSTFQGMGQQYASYEPIMNGAYNWRLSAHKMPDELWTHAICELNPQTNKYQSGSNVLGIDKIKLVTTESKNEFIQMLKEIEIK